MNKLLKNKTFQSILSALLCILVGLLVGFLMLLVINPAGAGKGILAIVKNFFYYSNKTKQMIYFGNTLVKTAPLLLCALSVLFANKAGLFNIGAAGQYVVGAGACLYCGIALHLPWFICVLAAMVAGAVLGAASGALKAYRNVNEVISCIMFNWISLYCVNMLLSKVKESTSPYTENLKNANPSALLPQLGMSNNQYVTIAIPLSVAIAVLVWVILERTRLGYELKATGNNKFAAQYAGMQEKQNLILTMAIAGALAGLAAASLYLTGYEQWSTTQSSVPGMGFNGIAAAFLGGLHPIGAVFASYFIQHITAGGTYLDKAVYCSQVSDFITAIIIYLCGFVLFMKTAMNGVADRREEKAAHKAAEQNGGKKE